MYIIKKLKDSFFGEKYRSSSFSAGLHELFHPAIPDGRTWSKLGEHGEHGKDGKHQPDDLKQSIYFIQNTLFVTQNTLFVNKMTRNTLVYGIYSDS